MLISESLTFKGPIVSQLRSHNTTSIQGDSSTINPRTSPTRQEDARAGNVLRASDSPKWYSTLNHILKFLQCCLHHLTLKRSTCYRITCDTPLSQVARQYPAHVVETSFRCGVCEGLESGDTQTVDAADIDDAGGRG